MKSVKIRLEELAEWTRLRAAWRRYRAGKRRRPEVAAFELNADRSLLRLSEALLCETYAHGAYRIKRIADPKPRLIAVAPVLDRVVHSLIHDALSPQFHRSFIQDTYACLPERGTHRALMRFLTFQRRFRYLVHLDIRCYYPSVDHGVLLHLLEPRIRDTRVVGLLEKILDSGWRLHRRPEFRAFFNLPPWDEHTRPHGLPIGNLTSQWWGNHYLSGLDHFAKRELKADGYLRYMDDLVLFADEPSTLIQWRNEIQDWLWQRRILTLNPGKGHIKPTRYKHEYLGYVVKPEGYDIGPKVGKRIRKRLSRLAIEDTDRFRRALTAWRGVLRW